MLIDLHREPVKSRYLSNPASEFTDEYKLTKRRAEIKFWKSLCYFKIKCDRRAFTKRGVLQAKPHDRILKVTWKSATKWAAGPVSSNSNHKYNTDWVQRRPCSQPKSAQCIESAGELQAQGRLPNATKLQNQRGASAELGWEHSPARQPHQWSTDW